VATPVRKGAAGLTGWSADPLDLALEAYLRTAPQFGLPLPDCDDVRAFFEHAFVAAPVQGGLLTGYFEPEVDGALARDVRFRHPLCAPPEDWSEGTRWASRGEIEEGDLLRGREIVWLDDPLTAFLAQVQGSVRVRITTGGTLRLGYAGKNGHPYVSIGAELVVRGEVPADRISVPAIRAWCAANPGRVIGLLRMNPSYVFFRRLDLDDATGPIGSCGQPVTPLRSIAVDPAFIPLGAPVWVESLGPERLSRLMIAQDTGSAIKGEGRGDVFFGTGETAGDRAGRMREAGRLTALVPRSAS
jgi:membrane-bound lytic murein transglycosylase A